MIAGELGKVFSLCKVLPTEARMCLSFKTTEAGERDLVHGRVYTYMYVACF